MDAKISDQIACFYKLFYYSKVAQLHLQDLMSTRMQRTVATVFCGKVFKVQFVDYILLNVIQIASKNVIFILRASLEDIV